MEIFSAPFAIYWCLFKARTAENELKNCGHVEGVAVQPHVHCFRRLLQHSLYHYRASNNGEPHWLYLKVTSRETESPTGELLCRKVADGLRLFGWAEETIIKLSELSNGRRWRIKDRTMLYCGCSHILSRKLPQYAAVVFAGSHFLALINIPYATEDRSPPT